MKIMIRQEQINDHKNIFRVNELAFGRDHEARLVDRLRNSDSFIPELSLVATLDQNIVGHILFTKIKIVNQNKNEHQSLALAPMSVIPEFQQNGIGGQLILNGLVIAKKLEYTSVIVLGHEHYYPKFGFSPAEKWNIQCPYDVPSIFFMAIELVTDGLKNVNGIVQYPNEFDEV